MQPYSSIDVTAAWKKLRFILSVRSDCWRSRDELIRDVLLWTPTHGREKQDDQHEHTFSSYLRIRDVVLKTCLGRWTIGMNGERGSGMSGLPARYDDDDDDTYCNWYSWYSQQRFGKKTRGLGNKEASVDNPNYSISEIDQNTAKSPGDFRRLVVTHSCESLSANADVKNSQGVKIIINTTWWERWSTGNCARKWNLTIRTNGTCTTQNPSRRMWCKKIYGFCDPNRSPYLGRRSHLVLNKKQRKKKGKRKFAV